MYFDLYTIKLPSGFQFFGFLGSIDFPKIKELWYNNNKKIKKFLILDHSD